MKWLSGATRRSENGLRLLVATVLIGTSTVMQRDAGPNYPDWIDKSGPWLHVDAGRKKGAPDPFEFIDAAERSALVSELREEPTTVDPRRWSAIDRVDLTGDWHRR